MTKPAKPKVIEAAVEIAAPVESVWKAITDPRELERWFPLEARVAPGVGGEVFLSLSVGLVHGYKEPYEDKLPLNNALGVGVIVVPAIGWQRGPLGLAASWAGTALTLRASVTFGP